MPKYEYKIGATWGALTNVESLAVPLPAPKHNWGDGSVRTALASGGIRSGGWAVSTWNWGFLTTAQRNAFRNAYCAYPAVSAEVFIQTKEEDEGYATFKGELVWPEEEEKVAGRVLNFSVTFQALEVYP